jgi:nucleotide-binding universal stress UspA family protein
MGAIAKILLPVDFSLRGVGAARYAAALAQHYGAELTVVRVIEPFLWAPPPDFHDGGRFDLEHIRDVEQRRLNTYGPPDFSDLLVKRVVLVGEAADSIVQQAESDKTDLIVMPTRGCGPFRRFLLGSVTAKVLHDARCPVWTGVHMEDTSNEQWKVIRNVACALDTLETDSDGPQTLKWAAAFAEEFGAALTIIHAIPAVTPLTHGFFDPGLWQELATKAREQMAGVKLLAGVQHADVLIEEGSASQAVSSAAKMIDADLLVIGRNPSNDLLGRLFDHAYPIIRESPCPVVSV